MLERLIAFTEFDIFAYLIVGLAALGSLLVIFHPGLLIHPQIGFGGSLAVAIGAYTLGHLISIPGHWLIEEALVRRQFLAPVEHLIKKDPKARDKAGNCLLITPEPEWTDATIWAYWRPLTCQLQDRIKQRSSDAKGRELFAKAYAAARSDAYARDRMLIFLRLYTFSRNLAVVMFAAATIALFLLFKDYIVMPAWRRSHPQSTAPPTAEEIAAQFRLERVATWATHRLTLAVVFTLFGLGLLLRFMEFYRLYSVEVLTSYASAASWME